MLEDLISQKFWHHLVETVKGSHSVSRTRWGSHTYLGSPDRWKVHFSKEATHVLRHIIIIIIIIITSFSFSTKYYKSKDQLSYHRDRSLIGQLVWICGSKPFTLPPSSVPWVISLPYIGASALPSGWPAGPIALQFHSISVLLLQTPWWVHFSSPMPDCAADIADLLHTTVDGWVRTFSASVTISRTSAERFW